jgi:hypothetical protein
MTERAKAIMRLSAAHTAIAAAREHLQAIGAMHTEGTDSPTDTHKSPEG